MPAPQQFQLFQPIGGVRAISSPTTIRSGRTAEPAVLRAVNVTGNVPGWFTTPVIRPVAASICNPSGRPAAVKLMGRSPVTGTA